MSLEQKVLRRIDSLSSSLVNLTRALVRVPSENPPGDERGVSQIVRERLESIGAHVDLVAELPERVNTLGTIQGSGGGRNLLINGHYDTVPSGDERFWTVGPFDGAMKDGKIFGRGACDMKSGVAAALIATQALVDSDASLLGNLLIHAVADEEPGSRYGTRYLIEKGYESRKVVDMAVVGEGSVFNDKIYVRPAVRGYQLFKVTTIGKAHHSSLPSEGINAVLKMGKVLEALNSHKFVHDHHQMLPDPSIVPGTLIKGGTAENVIPELCEAICDVRIVPGMTGEGVLEEARSVIEFLRTSDPELRAEVSSVFYWPPSEVAMTAKVYQIAETVTPKVTGYPLEPLGTSGSNDTSWLTTLAGIPSIAFGPGDTYQSGEHGPDEWVSVARLVDFAKIYALMALEACGVDERR